MKKFLLAVLVFGLCIPALSAFADTLELRNGSVIKGTFIGGSEAQITFRVGSSLQRYPVNDVVAIRFDSDSTSSSNYGNSGNYDNSGSYNNGQQNYPPPQSNYPPPPQSNARVQHTQPVTPGRRAAPMQIAPPPSADDDDNQ